MRRVAPFLSVALLLLTAISPAARGDERLEVGVEFSQIQSRFYDAIRGKPSDVANSRAATAARDDALKDLVTRAEVAKSQEHAPLAQAYQTLGRFDDAVREARAALAEGKKDSPTYTILIGCLSLGGKMDEAAKAFAESKEALGAKTNFGPFHMTLATGYQRAGRHEDAVEHIAEYLHSAWPMVVNSPERMASSFQNQVNSLTSSAMRAKSADKILPIVEKLEKRIAGEAAENARLKPIVNALQSAKVRILLAANDGEAAAKLADEQLAAAEKRLAADPKDRDGVLAVLAAKKLKLQAAGQGEQAGKLAADLNEFIETHLEAMVDSAPFLTEAGNAYGMRAYSLMSNDQFDEAAKALDAWKARFDGLKPENAEAKAVVAGTARSISGLMRRLVDAKKRAELIGQPYFPIEDAAWLNGSPLKPEELRGKVVLLDFWAVWCGPCIATFPHLTHLHEAYGDKGLVIVGVTKRYGYDWDAEAKRPKNVDELAAEKEDAATSEFVKHHGLKHRIAVLPDTSLTVKYMANTIPQVVLVDQQGLIRLIKVGNTEANAKALEAAIRQSLDLPVVPAGE